MRRAKPGRRSKPARLYFRKPRHGGEGQWVILDRNANGHRVEIGTGASEPDCATAQKKFSEYLAEKHRPNFGAGHPAEVLITDALVIYAEHMAERGAGGDNLPSSLVHLGEYFASNHVSDLTPVLCEQYVPWRIGKGDARTGNKPYRVLKPVTARNDLVVLEAALRFAVRNHKLTYSPPIAKPAASEPRVRSLTRSEAARLLAAALGWDQHGRRHRARINRHLARFIITGLHTGTRKDRIQRLMWMENLQGGWIDLERGVLELSGNLGDDV